MGYSAADESFTHQLPRPFDEVHDPDASWSDRCYFFAHSPDGDVLVTSGYGNNPNQRAASGYGKVALGDGRHWDLGVGRRLTVETRDELAAGPMRWTCVEPLKRWRVELGPNNSGIEWAMEYEPRAPMWELLPMHVEVDGRVIVDMFHIKESGRWTGWVSIDGERISVDGWHGGRDRTFGVRVADEINFWIWLDAGFEDRAVQAWLIEDHDGNVQYVDGGITYTNGTVSKRFVSLDHEIEFDHDLKRPARAVLTFTDEDGATHRLTADSPQQQATAYYGMPLSKRTVESRGGGEYFFHFPWNSTDVDELHAVESTSVSLDQLMRFDLDGQSGLGIFEILTGSDSSAKYPNWPPMDMTPFRQHARVKPADRASGAATHRTDSGA
jgi:hypothetical protein